MPGMQQFSSAANNRSNNNHHTNSSSSHNNNNNSSSSYLDTVAKMHSLDLNASSFDPAASAFAANVVNASPPEFDFSMPCRYFKSSFARSLSLNNASNHNHCKSLDFEINSRSSNNNSSSSSNNVAAKNSCPPLPSRLSRAETPAHGTSNLNSNLSSSNNNSSMMGNNEVSCCDEAKPPAIPARRPVPTAAFDVTTNVQTHHKQQQQQQQQQLHHHHQQQQQSLTQFRHAAVAAGNSNAVAAHGNFNKVINQTPQQQQQQQQQHHQLNNIGSNSNSNFRRNIVWPSDTVEQDCNLSDEAEHGTALHHRGGGGGGGRGVPFEVHHENNNTMNVEAVILQNQVDTLQWQLKQVETSCKMYRAVMEEVARFFDRYHSQKQQLRQQQQNRNGMEQISRSKSLYHVYGASVVGGHDKTSPPSGDEAGVSDYDAIAPSLNSSYNAFKDFTWRRSPKKLQDCRAGGIASVDSLEDKLNQEAFRLSRTIHNLLNTSTQQPDLTHHRNSRLGQVAATGSTMSLLTPMLNSTSLSEPVAEVLSPASDATPKNNSSLATEMLFLRSANMRDSRLSLRSSTDSSVHSTISSAASSSSKVETDEEYHSSPTLLGGSNKQIQQRHQPQLGSTTEDESGFSSISSQDIGIGVPLSSTLLSNTPVPVSRHSLATIALVHGHGDTADYAPHEFHQLESRNPTLQPAHSAHVVGVPLHATHDMQHRWDALPPSKTSYRNAVNKNQRFSTLSNDDSATVLWV